MRVCVCICESVPVRSVCERPQSEKWFINVFLMMCFSHSALTLHERLIEDPRLLLHISSKPQHTSGACGLKHDKQSHYSFINNENEMKKIIYVHV